MSMTVDSCGGYAARRALAHMYRKRATSPEAPCNPYRPPRAQLTEDPAPKKKIELTKQNVAFFTNMYFTYGLGVLGGAFLLITLLLGEEDNLSERLSRFTGSFLPMTISGGLLMLSPLAFKGVQHLLTKIRSKQELSKNMQRCCSVAGLAPFVGFIAYQIPTVSSYVSEYGPDASFTEGLFFGMFAMVYAGIYGFCYKAAKEGKINP